jgi:lipopolysaccharide export system protein LptA
MDQRADRIHTRPHRAVRALRALVLFTLAGFTIAVVMTFGRRGRPQTEITMAPIATQGPAGPVTDQSDEFEISGSREGRPAFTLRARTVTGFSGDRKLLAGVHLTLHDEDSMIRIDGVEGQFDAAARRAQLAGDVVIESGDGVSMKTGTLYYDSDRDMIFTADDVLFTAGAVEGRGRGLNYLVGERQIKIPDRVQLSVRDATAGPPIAITSGDLVAALKSNSVVFTDDVRLERRGDVLYGNYLKIVLDPDKHRVRQLSAFGDVVATLAPAPGGRASELRADSLTVTLSGPDGTIELAEASGGCRVTSGAYTSRSRTARYRRDVDLLELRGDPVVMTDRERIAGQEVDLHPETRRLEARGDVRTVSLPAAAGNGVPGMGGGSAVSFQASSLSVDQDGRRAVYTGGARAWQEGNSVQGEEIVVDQGARQLRATTRVMARFTQRRGTTAGGSGSPAAAPLVTALTADSMVFDDALGAGRYRGNVRLTRLGATLTADAMDAYLAERGGERRLLRIEAQGSVAVKRGGSFGTARSAEYLATDDLLILKDDEGLAEVVDAASGRVMRGRTLTFDLAGDRILTETARGARTWITLQPEPKDVQPVEPKTRH